MKNEVKKCYDAGADNWDMLTEEEIAKLCVHWLSSPWNQAGIGEAIERDGMILADILSAAFQSRMGGAKEAAVGACVMDIIRRQVRSEVKHIFKEVAWEREGV